MTPVPYEHLTPEIILDAVESAGVRCDGRILALNSYENRVYQVGLEDGEDLVAKFYRPGRWSDEAIQEEHQFAFELAAAEIPAIAPLGAENGEGLRHFDAFRFAIYPKCRGRAPELESEDTLRWMGRFLGRLHAIGATLPFRARPSLNLQTFGIEPAATLFASGFIPEDLTAALRTTLDATFERIARCFEQAGAIDEIRLHGDCHAGNVLWTVDGPYFVDFDDARMGPAVQDLWMLLAGDREAMSQQLDWVLDGYCEFADFNFSEIRLIEALRALRLIHYAAWIASRWADPAFPRAFPWFDSHRYWQDLILNLREQCALMDEPPLQPGFHGYR